MHKLIIFLALFACAVALGSRTVEHQKHSQKVHPHHAAAHSGAGVGHADHTGRVARDSHGLDLRVFSNGQKETVHHGPVVSPQNKQFRRVKKTGGKNLSKLRRVHSSDKYRRH